MHVFVGVGPESVRMGICVSWWCQLVNLVYRDIQRCYSFLNE